MLNRLFRRGGGGGVEDGLLAGESGDTSGLIRFECFVRRNVPVDPSRFVFGRVVICRRMRRFPTLNTA